MWSPSSFLAQASSPINNYVVTIIITWLIEECNRNSVGRRRRSTDLISSCCTSHLISSQLFWWKIQKKNKTFKHLRTTCFKTKLFCSTSPPLCFASYSKLACFYVGLLEKYSKVFQISLFWCWLTWKVFQSIPKYSKLACFYVGLLEKYSKYSKLACFYVGFLEKYYLLLQIQWQGKVIREKPCCPWFGFG